MCYHTNYNINNYHNYYAKAKTKHFPLKLMIKLHFSEIVKIEIFSAKLIIGEKRSDRYIKTEHTSAKL